MNLVSIQHTACYEQTTVQESVDAHFAELCLDKICKPGMKVAIKPNLLMKRKPYVT